MSKSNTYFYLRAVAAGVVYGVFLRILMALDINAFTGLMSLSFFVFVPAAIGFIVVYFDPSIATRRAWQDPIGPAISMVAFLLSSVILMLEGSICVLIALPWFLLVAIVGGLVAGWLKRRRLLQGHSLSVVLLLPIIASPIEAHFPAHGAVLSREDTLIIQASPEAVWNQITNVDEIDTSELRFGLTRILGVPRPVSASMDYSAASLIRRTNWDKGIFFAEEIIHWSEHEDMKWRFVFSADSVPPGVLDEHVEIGGDYFDLISGGYSLRHLPDGSTELSLATSYRVSSRPRKYSEWWANLVMRDFHIMILDLIRNRSEKMQANKSLHPPPDASVTALAFATAAPDAGAGELKR